MTKLKRHIDFINENDNLDRSIKGMDRFGITDFKRLPLDLEKVLKIKGFEYSSNHDILDSTDESIHIKIYFDKLSVEFYLNTTDDIGKPNKDTYISVAFNNYHGSIFLVSSVERRDYKKMLKLANDIDSLAEEVKNISTSPAEEREEKFENIFSRYGLDTDYIDPGSDITTENLDNTKRSEAGMGRFGMNVYDVMPNELKEAALKNGFSNTNVVGYDSVSEKSVFSKEILEEEEYDTACISIYISIDEHEKFSKDSAIIYTIDLIGEKDMLIEVVRDRHDNKDIKSLLYKTSEIENNIKPLIESLTDDTQYNVGLVNTFMKDITGLDHTIKNNFKYYG